MLKKIGLNSIIVLVLVSLVGCGFHLRGAGLSGSLPFQTAQIETNGTVTKNVQKALKLQLLQSGVEVLESQSAEIQIQLMSTKSNSTSTSSRLGDTTSELIKVTQPYKVTNLTTGKIIVSGESVVYHDSKINITDALASNRELRSIQKAMSEKVASQIIERIRRAMLAKTQVTQSVVNK